MAESTKQIVWAVEALSDLAEIYANIADYSSMASADNFVKELFETIVSLEKHPHRYAPCRFPKLHARGWRCFTFRKKYLVIYAVDADVSIIAVKSSKRNPEYLESLADE